jgi:serine/threonine-protein kinase RsbW
MQHFGIKEDFLGILSVPLNECVKNAVIHGNKCDKTKKVVIEVQLKKSKLCFSVSDEGEGFDYESVMKTTPEQQEKNGLCIVKMLAQNPTFSRNGTQISYTIDVPFSCDKNRQNQRAEALLQSQISVKNSQI